jgi:splicing suppressor protein 51
MDIWKGAYHDYAKIDGYIKPDLAVAFHTGHSQEEVESWKPTIKYLVSAGHCTVHTTFNEKEMKEESQGLKSLRAKFLQEGVANKWKGMRAFLEVVDQGEKSLYYNNQYWYIVDGR